MTYVIAHFKDTNEVELVPSNWLLSKKESYWPPYTAKLNIKKAVIIRETPHTDTVTPGAFGMFGLTL